MIQIKDLVIPQLGVIIDESLETTRKKLKIERSDFVKLLQADDDGIFGILDDTLTDFILNQIGEDYIEHQVSVAQRNQNTILQEHKEIFHYYFLYVHSCHIVFENLRQTVEKKQVAVSDLILICLHGSLCRMAEEIGNSLSNGSTRAALAQWRIFYEHVVIGVFLMQEDSPELFRKFSDFSHRDARKQKESFNIHFKDLKFPPLEKDFESKIDMRSEELKDTYGKDFFDDYAWAKTALKEKGRPDFRKIEAQAGMSRYRPFYIWASNYTHPNFRSITGMQSDKNIFDLLDVVQPTIEKESYIDPMQLTTITFLSFLDRLLYKYSVNYEYTTNALFFRKIIDRLKDKF